jgi:hypothetical protein
LRFLIKGERFLKETLSLAPNPSVSMRLLGLLMSGAFAAAPLRATDPIPLWRYYQAAWRDNLVAATQEMATWALSRNYSLVRQEGFIVPCPGTRVACGCAPGLFPLSALVRTTNASSGSLDAYLGLASLAGPEFLRLGDEGCASTFPAAPAAPFPCAPLQIWRSDAVRLDTDSVVNRSSVEDVRGDDGGECPGCGYSHVRIEACLPSASWARFPGAGAPPPGSPFAPSARLRGGVSFSSRVGYYPRTGADTWFPSWGADDQLYSVFTDGVVAVDLPGFDAVPYFDPPSHAAQVASQGAEVACCSSCGLNDTQNTGSAVLSGGDPFSLRVTPLGCERASAWPYGGRYPSANLHFNGSWFVGTYALWPAAPSGGSGLGPFVGFRTSADGGATWLDDGRLAATNIFGEEFCESRSTCTATGGAAPRIRFGAPHFVDYGKNMGGSPDGRAYLIGHGCVLRSLGWKCDWNVGDTVFLARTTGPPSPGTISAAGAAAWEFWAGEGRGYSPNLTHAAPLFAWAPHGTGIVTMTWHAALGLYLTWVSTPNARDSNTYDAYLLESTAPEGPFFLVDYLYQFGKQGYFLNSVSKFAASGAWGGDPTTGILAYSADYTFNTEISPRGGRYGLVTAEFRVEPS